VAFEQALVRDDDAALTRLSAGWTYSGYRMAAFSTAEERVAEGGQLGGKVRFYPSEALAAAGAKVETAAKWKSQVVQDRELITGQQPYSDELLADLLVKALDAKRPATGARLP
jgi:putative intracellular protease/amidase